MYNPVATYRIQFNKDFTFKHLEIILPYLKDLGIKTIYASPIFAATPGSMHGYDVTSSLQLNPEIGTEEDLLRISAKLKDYGMGWLQDIVPNHMAFHTSNVWLMDVLERWKDSPYFSFFDIDIPTEMEDNRLMVPFLGEPLEEAINQHKLFLTSVDDKWVLEYGGEHWPVSIPALELIKTYLDTNASALTAISEDKNLLKRVCDKLFYRFCFWKETEQQVNYRRFFTVNGLICLNIQEEAVFEFYHQYILALIGKDVFQGLRIDHVDGLADPEQYLKRLRKAVGDEVYISVEKILAAKETLPNEWSVQGSSGYDFLAVVNNVLTNTVSKASFNELYQEIIEKPLDVHELMIKKKRSFLYTYMYGELNHLVSLFDRLGLMPVAAHAVSFKESLRIVIAELLINSPVYRYYSSEYPLTEEAKNGILDILKCIPDQQNDALTYIKSLFMRNEDWNSKGQAILHFFQRCMQFSGPLMAKGVEDTLMYTYNRFVAHAEVGDAPGAFGIPVSAFHSFMKERLEYFPLSQNTTATHDTKKGEDVRARLNVLSDVPSLWQELAMKIQDSVIDYSTLHINDAYFIVQTVFGILPFEEESTEELNSRLEEYIQKALREAKKRSDWGNPSEDYEMHVKEFAYMLIQKEGAFYPLFRALLDKVSEYAMLNSLIMVVLKCTTPGIPDIYQGTELWDLSLVDPDNRRGVNYDFRSAALEEVKRFSVINEAWAKRNGGEVKLWLLRSLLQLRTQLVDLFTLGSYQLLNVEGKYSRHILAYYREWQGERCLIIIALGMAGLVQGGNGLSTVLDWTDTAVLLPVELSDHYEDLLTGVQYQWVNRTSVMINDIMPAIPILVLFNKRFN